MAVETTLVLVKPDGVRRALCGEILARFERKGLRIAALKHTTLDRAIAEQHGGSLTLANRRDADGKVVGLTATIRSVQWASVRSIRRKTRSWAPYFSLV